MNNTLETQNTILEPHRFSVAEYRRIFENGILPFEPRSQLIQGEIYFMAAMNKAHFDALRILNKLLLKTYGHLVEVSNQAPVQTWDDSQPEPDFALLHQDYPGGIPVAADVLLVIEVSDSSLKFDREKKLPEYAKSAIPEAWILNLIERQLEVYRQPSGEQYLQRQIVLDGTAFAPAFAPENSIEWFLGLEEKQ